MHRTSGIHCVTFNQLTNPLEKRASFARNVARFVVVAVAISQQIGANYKIYVHTNGYSNVDEVRICGTYVPYVIIQIYG